MLLCLRGFLDEQHICSRSNLDRGPRCNVICDQGFFAFEDSGIYLVAKTSSLIMLKNELPIEKVIHSWDSSCISEHNHDQICITCIG